MANDNFHVFISWSKEPSKQIAEEIKQLFEAVFAINGNIKFFLSSSDGGGIGKGERFLKVLNENLSKCNFGIIVLTKNNIEQPWIMYEAGSLAKDLEKGKVTPIFFDIEEIEKGSPLFQFQHVKYAKEEFYELAKSILKAYYNDDSLTENAKNNILKSLDEKWPRFEESVDEMLKSTNYKINDLAKSLSLSKTQPHLKREKHLEGLIRSIDNNRNSRIVIFGGISSIVRDSTKDLAKWLIANETSQLFICYEDEKLVNDRDKDLVADAYDLLDKSDGIYSKSDELRKRKITEFADFKNYFTNELGPSPNSRIYFIELSERLSGYVTINGCESFFTPLLHKRSEETYTFELTPNQLLDVVDYMISKLSDGCSLISELEKVKSEIS